MSKTFLIFRHELSTLFSFWSYRFLVFFPLTMGLALSAGPKISQIFSPASAQQAPSAAQDPFTVLKQLFAFSKLSLPQGFVDQSGLVTQYPPNFDCRLLVPFSSEAEAHQAMQAGQIGSYYLIPPSYLSIGWVMKFVPAGDSAWLGLPDSKLDVLLDYNLADADDERLDMIKNPIVNLQEVNLSPQKDRSLFDPDDPTKGNSYMTAYLTAFALWMAIFIPGFLLVTGLNRESENRVMEILVSSARTDEIILGKFAGLGLGGLIVLASIFVGVAVYILPVGRYVISGMQRMTLETLIWAAAFALSSYVLFGLITTTLGMIMPNSGDAGTVASFALMPFVIPIFLFQIILDRPNDPVALAVSFFPLTSPTAVLMRLMAAPVPTWQLIASLSLLLASILGILKLASGLLRTRSLLTGFSISYFLKSQFYRLIHH